VDVGGTIVVHWDMVAGQTTAYDWVGLFSIDQPNKQYITYQYKGKEPVKGTLSFYAPSTNGEYEFRYFSNGAYEHLAMSNRIKVGPQFEVVANQPQGSNKILVKWKQISGNEYSRAWIGLFEKAQVDNKLCISWQYATKPAFELTFDMPVKPRSYEFRLFSNSYIDVAKSNVISVEGEDSITASIAGNVITLKPNVVTVHPQADTVWVGLYFVGETNHRQWRRYKWITDRTADIQFKAPNTAGIYEARMFANKTYDLLLKSNSFVIPAAPVVASTTN